MKINIHNQKGEEVGNLEVSKTLFDLPWNADLVHQVLTSMQANKREPWAHTKGRGDVSGGGKKPWRQKGTGRARHGSTRSPIWVGGGVTHGPTKDRNFSKKINKKMNRKAFFTVLSQKLRDNEILFLDTIVLAETKTKDASKILKDVSNVKGFEKLATKRKNKALLAIKGKDNETIRSFRNIPGMEISELRNANLLDLLTYKYLIISNPKESLDAWKK